ncbi:MAG: hypothetical protein SGJ04_00755 [Bacteroidota bacterium]|nr:hypothetical protein [Bacteroidota bacterium]
MRVRKLFCILLLGFAIFSNYNINAQSEDVTIKEYSYVLDVNMYISHLFLFSDNTFVFTTVSCYTAKHIRGTWRE